MPKLGRRNEENLNYLTWTQDAVTGTAPFGTSVSPNMRIKIVGGKPVQTFEYNQQGKQVTQTGTQLSEHHLQNTQDSSRTQKQQQPKLAPLTEKPNHLSPPVFIDKKGNTYQSAQPDTHKSHIHSPDPHHAGQMNPHQKLPPISPSPQQAPPPIRFSPPPVYYTTSPTPRHAPPRSPSPHLSTPRKSLLALEYSLPSDGNLPLSPIILKNQDEVELRERIYKNMKGFNPKKFKDIYLDLTGFDRDLSGLVNFYHLGLTLVKFEVNISPEDLRLVASIFMDGESGQVYYEKVLAFLASSMNGNDAPSNKHIRKPGTDQPGGYYNLPAGDPQPGKPKKVTPPSPRGKRFPFGDRDNAKLLRLIEQQLLDAEEEIDLNNVWQTFRASDRDHRGKMSREQIKSLVVGCRIPLQTSLMNHIIDRCDSSNGQYDWTQFLEFIERVQPVKTGLGIPASKRPSEYVKHYPQPTDDWPRNTGSPRAMPTYNQTGRPHADPPTDDNPPISDRGRYGSERSPPRPEPLNNQNHQERGQMSHRQDPDSWFERFMRFAGSLYDLDEHGLGYLPVDQVRWTLERYNDAYMLEFDERTMQEAVATHSSNGRVTLDTFLKTLGNRGP